MSFDPLTELPPLSLDDLEIEQGMEPNPDCRWCGGRGVVEGPDMFGVHTPCDACHDAPRPARKVKDTWTPGLPYREGDEF